MGFLVITQSLVKSETRYSVGFQVVKCEIPTSCGECGASKNIHILPMGFIDRSENIDYQSLSAKTLAPLCFQLRIREMTTFYFSEYQTYPLRKFPDSGLK